jgi:50S ribosomal protein L16 3-hydroxylase
MQNLDQEAFLREHWQQSPLLIRNAVPDYEAPLSAEELAGLALEADVESRLIGQHNANWFVENGPLHASSFQREAPWTLLVQALDQQLPEIASLRQLVNFIPGWRFDDIMASYATDGGGVGPHYDNYDVFLLQVSGQREWRLGQECAADEPLQPNKDLRLLADFRESARYLLEPGDVLYVPPRMAHWGIAVGECITFSLGFRAPRLSDMLSRRVDQLLETMDSESLYRDSGGFGQAQRPGEIDLKQLQSALRQVSESLTDDLNADWFGELVSEPRYPLQAQPDTAVTQATRLLLDPASRLFWFGQQGSLTAYANGQAIPCSDECQPLLEMLCRAQVLSGDELNAYLAKPSTRNLLQQLLDLGCFDGEY